MTGTRGSRIKAVPAHKQVPDSFQLWVKQKSQKAKVAIETLFAIPGLTLIFSLFNLFGRKFLPDTTFPVDVIVMVVLFAQFAIVGLMYFFIPSVPNLRERVDGSSSLPNTERIVERGARYSNLWSYAWLCWAILYFGLGMNSLAKQVFPTANLWFVDPAAHLLNNIQTIFFIMCFKELRDPNKNQRSPLAAATAIAVVLAVCETFFLIPGVLGQDSFGVGLSEVLGWASGVLGGTAIALLVGRLETKLINAPVLMTIIFYLYASIQGAFPFIIKDDHVALVFTSLAFMFKLCLFYFMAWLIESGVLLFYFEKMFELDDKTPRERQSFLENTIARSS